MADDKATDEGSAQPDAGGGAAQPDAAISNGPNARPRNETISQTGPGLPDDTSQPVEITPDEEARIAERIRAL